MKRGQTAVLRHRLARKLAFKLGAGTRAIWTDQRGVAAIEFGFFGIFLAAALANVTDVSIYVYQRMQVENATQVAAQAAWKACDLPQLPATVNCPGLATAVANALKSTSLGTRVAMMAGSPSEGYYCVNSSNALQYVSIQTGNLYGDGVELRALGRPALHEVVDADPTLIDFGAVGGAGFLFQNQQIRPNEPNLRQAMRTHARPRDADARVELLFGEFDQRRDRVPVFGERLDLLEPLQLRAAVIAGAPFAFGRRQTVAPFPRAQTFHADAGEFCDGADPVQLGFAQCRAQNTEQGKRIVQLSRMLSSTTQIVLCEGSRADKGWRGDST